MHTAYIHLPEKGKTLLLLREVAARDYCWYREIDSDVEEDTGIRGDTPEEALRAAHRHWRLHSFRTLICGFRYTLPERDECGMNALFHQMVASHRSANGVYYDEDVGHNCYVQNASQESLDLWKRLESQQRL